MFNTSQKISRPQKIIGGLAILAILWIAGCGDFFDRKPTEIETRRTLDELSRIPENPNVGNPLPEMYRGPAKRIKAKEGVMLFYFTKHHTVEKLTQLINNQFAEMSTDDEGKTIYAPYYSVGESPATNQLVIQCPNDEEVDKVLEFLRMVDVPPIQVNIDCLILERYADVTMDWETTSLVENLLGEGITLGGKTEWVEEGSGNWVENLLPTFPGAALRESKRREFGLNFGYWRNQGVEGHQFRAAVDVLISRGYLKILMNPTLETVNGQKAKVTSRENVGLEKIVMGKGYDSPYSMTEYQWVEDSLEVTPHTFADGSIGLETSITLGSKSIPEGVVQTSVITERKAEMTENRIAPGDSLVIAGIRKTTKRDVMRGVPFLKDIPIIGILFSSRDFEERATEVIFILTPSISSGGVEYAKMMEEMREKYATPEYKTSFEEMFTDPFGTSAYADRVEKEAEKAEFERFKAELEKAEVEGEVDVVKEKLLDAAEEVIGEKAKALRAQVEARKAKEQADKAKAEAEQAKKEAEEAKKVFLEAQKEAEEAEEAEDTPEQPQSDT
ncbi:type II secretion system protein GspD [Planctomycetota bacterium]